MTGPQRSTKKKKKWASLLAHALRYPEAWEDHPWEETVVKVGKKIFVFLSSPEHGTITVKLDDSLEAALTVDGAAPAGYGLGRAGWVTVPIAAVPVGILRDWIDESYRRVAPGRLVAAIEGSVNSR